MKKLSLDEMQRVEVNARKGVRGPNLHDVVVAVALVFHKILRHSSVQFAKIVGLPDSRGIKYKQKHQIPSHYPPLAIQPIHAITLHDMQCLTLTLCLVFSCVAAP